MSSDKQAGNGVIVAWVPGLESTPGWVALSRKKQDALLEHTSHIQQFRHMQRLGEFGELIELTQVQQLLDGEEMHMDNYLKLIYPQHHDRTIQRKHRAYIEMAANIPNPVLKRIAAAGQDVIGKFDRIAAAAMGDILNAVREMPLLSVNTDKDAERFMEDLNGKLAEERKTRRQKGLHKDQGFAEKMATNALIHYIRESGVKTSAEKRQFISRVVSWTMEAEAVHGTIQASRVAIPEEMVVRRGRPRKHPRKEAA